MLITLSPVIVLLLKVDFKLFFCKTVKYLKYLLKFLLILQEQHEISFLSASFNAIFVSKNML
jgi:hypothetical protein